jgi:hypothetical protein
VTETTFCDDVAAVLQGLGLGISASSLFVGVEPTTKVDPCVVVYAEPSPPGMQTHSQVRPVVEYPRARVTARSVDYNQAQKKAEEIYIALWIHGQEVNGHMYANVWPMGRPYGMGPPDANGRRPVGFIIAARQLTS